MAIGSKHMKRKFIKDISANMLQMVINQGCGLVIFYVLSLSLSKDVFGELNWSLAVLLTLFGVLSFGIDQVAVRKVAAGADAQWVLRLYFAHVLYWGLFAYLLLALAYWLFPVFFVQHNLLLLIGIGKLAIFFASPFKQIANGLEKFRALLYMATFSNIVRSVALLLLYGFGACSIEQVVIIFIAGDVLEWLLCFYIMHWRMKIPISLVFQLQAYKNLLKEAAPQLLSVILTTTLSRLDWILIGLFCAADLVANYSFAWKAFEAATLPLLIIGPVLLTRFAKLFAITAPPLTANQWEPLMALLRVEMVVASGSALLLNLLWVPVIDTITNGAYGAINSTTILLLSIALPFLYLNNFLWTINFAKHRMRRIVIITALTFIVNAGIDVLLIPQYSGVGAAIAFMAAIVLQAILFVLATPLSVKPITWLPVLVSPLCAAIAGLAAHYFFTSIYAVIACALLLYIVLILGLKQLRRTDILLLQKRPV